MNHPENVKAWSPGEIVDFTEKHFIHDASPRCTMGKGNGCVYCSPDGNGCFLGILLTKEDAKTLDENSVGSISGVIQSDVGRDILTKYTLLHRQNLPIISIGQYAHDELWEDPDFDRKETFKLLRQVLASYSK